MAKYRRKEEIVEAVQWLGWDKGPHDLGIIQFDEDARLPYGFLPNNPREPHGMGSFVSPGDWIITYPSRDASLSLRVHCPAAQFDQYFEPVKIN